MLVVAIDIGSYSVKTVTVQIDRNKTTHISNQEIKIEHYEKYNAGLSLRENQMFIVKDIIEVVPANAKVIMTIEEDMVTTRFLTLPVKSRKKAELMIPFQIDDEIPYSINEAHLANSIRVEKESSFAIVNIYKKDQFEQYLEDLKQKTDLPDILTTSTVSMANTAQNEFSDNNFCILDMGHSRVRAYFFHKGHLSSFYTCFQGGKDIDIEIAQRYNIKLEDAQVYKHQNCFVLTNSQKEMADQKQKEFSSLMEAILSRFMSDLRRWELGHRVGTGFKVGHIYLTGGTSNIRGLDQYIEEQIGISTERFPNLTSIHFKKPIDEQYNSKFILASFLAASYQQKSLIANALSDQYSQTGSDELPLNTMAFVGVRSILCMLVVILSLSFESYLLDKERVTVSNKIKDILKKSTDLNLTPREERMAVNNPQSLLQKIKKLGKTMEKEVSTIKSSTNINALNPLTFLVENLGKIPATLISYSSIDGILVNAIYKSDQIEVLEKLEKDLTGILNNKKPVISIDKEKLILTLEASIK